MNQNKLPVPLKITEQQWPEDTEVMVTISSTVYNHGQYLRDALEGFLMQETTFRVEILIHDDASTDGSDDLIRQYLGKYPQLIKCFFQKENTYFKPNKHELRREFRMMTRGKYICHCEGDDYWIDPLKLQKQVSFLESNPEYAMCFHKAKVVAPEGQEHKLKIYSHLKEGTYIGKQIFQDWTVPTASIMYRAQFREKIIQTDKHPDFLFHDIIMFLALADCGKIYCLGDTMSVYRIHDASITNRPDPSRNLRYIKHLKAIMNSFDGKYAHVADHLVSNTYLSMMVNHLKNKQWLSAIKSLLLSIRYHPLMIWKRIYQYSIKKISKSGN